MRMTFGSSISARAISISFCCAPRQRAGVVATPLADQGEALGERVGPPADEPLIAQDVAADQHVVPDGHEREQAALLGDVHGPEREHLSRRACP